ncbi:ABC-type putative branched-chain amino acidtransporter [Striga asiatica]|uniref:ABC-type putative branched-chain amino acidtransporter n=1 Tax=Striga asiatica TaxID=4170 RepID=A0A5A7PV40_STRAF|nr:ABC-type putative branched-chain amino acidtransporter [Striga asiatica]
MIELTSEERETTSLIVKLWSQWVRSESPLSELGRRCGLGTAGLDGRRAVAAACGLIVTSGKWLVCAECGKVTHGLQPSVVGEYRQSLIEIGESETIIRACFRAS